MRDTYRWLTVGIVQLLVGVWLLTSILTYQPLDGTRVAMFGSAFILLLTGGYCGVIGSRRR